ncbi:hypothetical protein [Rhizohabitans arisaemae]|uniref:hypothetical protein n=1 Tax=Rhizohabitans arisaemae TaxID=2720610 RepID=UPI0024B0B8AE|nr:hypothetical protein [Rhizohabitans arisaemae]
MVDRVVRRVAAIAVAVAIGVGAFAFTAPAASALPWMISGPYDSQAACNEARNELFESGGANVVANCQWRNRTQTLPQGWYFRFIAY